jgi:hypothetical protein
LWLAASLRTAETSAAVLGNTATAGIRLKTAVASNE